MKTTSIFVFSAFMLLSALTATAQSSFKLDPKTTTFIDNAMMECIYKYTVNAPLKKSQTNEKRLEIYTTILQANASVSKFWDWHFFKKDSIISTSTQYSSPDSIRKLERRYNTSVKNIFLPVIFKNHPKDKITVTDEIIPGDYIYEENKTDRNWTLMDDTLTVCGYLCNKAVTTFGGREWTAWYAPDITLSDGPWKLYGLPGLILKAEDASGTHTFEATSIRKSDQPVYSTKNFSQIKIERNKFIKNKNAYEENPIVPANAYMEYYEFYELVFYDGKRSSRMRETKYCPLELE